MRLQRITYAILATALVAGTGTASHAQATSQILPAPSAAASTTSNSLGTVRSGTYYEDHAQNYACGSVFANCFLIFATTPTDKFLTITNVDCMNVSAGLPTQNTFLLQGGSRTRALPVTPALYGATPTGGYAYFLNFNAPLNFKVGVGKTLMMNFFRASAGSTVFYMDCTISGILSDPEY